MSTIPPEILEGANAASSVKQAVEAAAANAMPKGKRTPAQKVYPNLPTNEPGKGPED